jgi:cytochrome c oxidase assembly protein subunit 15
MIDSKLAKRLSLFANGMIAFCLIVVLWGAFVRFSHSGDGCGASWPLCSGSFIPLGSPLATWIEYSHRITSGAFGVGILFLVLFLFLKTPKGSVVRLFGAGALLFTFTEALIGAGLVLRELVGSNTSGERALWLIAHLMNTLLLFYFLVGISAHAKQYDVQGTFRNLFPNRKMLLPLLFFLLLAMCGSIASLSNSLYPSFSLADGIAKDFATESPLLVRLRLLHPLLAFLFLATSLFAWRELLATLSFLKDRIHWLIIANVLVGIALLLLLSPVEGKLLHLFFADLIWIALCFAACSSLRDFNC